MENSEMISVKATAQILNVPILRVYNLINREGLPAVKLGAKTIRIPRAGLEQWLDDRTIKRPEVQK